MFRSENRLRNACACVFSEQTIHPTSVYYELSSGEPKCLEAWLVWYVRLIIT